MSASLARMFLCSSRSACRPVLHVSDHSAHLHSVWWVGEERNRTLGGDNPRALLHALLVDTIDIPKHQGVPQW